MKLPTFSSKSELVRYISEHNRNGRRASPAAFLDPPSDNPKRDYLSVNSLEVESMQAIANYHREIWQNNVGEVALAAHKVFYYTEAGRKCGVTIRFNHEVSCYEFDEGGRFSLAYQHIPRTDRYKSPSHAGVHFVRALKKAHQLARFARRMSGKKCHLL